MAESSGSNVGTSDHEIIEVRRADVQTFEVVKRVTVYWRPGCSSCARMLRGLRANEVSFEEMNIWDDPTSAAMVGALADGNETVPTVVVDTVSLVNPSVATVLTAISGASAAGDQGSERLCQLRRLTIGIVVTASLVVDLLGHHSLSWVLDGVAINVYVAWRVVEHWTARHLQSGSPSTILPSRP